MFNPIKKFFNDTSFPPNERLWLFCSLIFICGYLGGFTFTVRGNLFVNAQTGNLVYLSVGIGTFNKTLIFQTLSLFLIYSLGLISTEIISKKYKKKYLWEQHFFIFSIFLTFIIGLFPETLPFEFTLFPIAFIVAAKFVSFEKVQGLTMATGFCTNHLKQTCLNFVRFLRTKDIQKLKNSISHFCMIISFVLGTSLAVYLGPFLHEKTIWLSTFFTVITLICFRNSIKTYKTKGEI